MATKTEKPERTPVAGYWLKRDSRSHVYYLLHTWTGAIVVRENGQPRTFLRRVDAVNWALANPIDE
jgi:hypothetical protein